MIKPTVGRVVWYWPNGSAEKLDQTKQPCAATISHVHSDDCVNLGVLDPSGNHYNATSVRLVCDPTTEAGEFAFCEWPIVVKDNC